MPLARKAGITGIRTASVAASRPTKLPNVSPRPSPTLTIINRTRRSIVEMDLRPVTGRVGIDSWRPCSPYGGWPPSRHWGCRVTPMRARCEGNWSPQTSQFSGSFGNGDDLADGEVMGIHSSSRGMTGYPTILHASAELSSVASMVENWPFDMSVGMLSPASAAEVCGADAEGYNALAVLPPGAFDVQSIRTSQTADPRAKQTYPAGPARGSARVNTRLGDGDSPGSMPAGRFYWGEVVESFLGQPPLAGFPVLVDGSGAQRGGTGNLRCSPKPAPAKAGGLKKPSPRCSPGWVSSAPHPRHGQPAHPSAQACPPELVEGPVWPPWYPPSTSNCLPPRSTANWTEWWNNSGSPFPRWQSCWRMPRRTSWPSRPSQWPTGRSCGPTTHRNG